MTQKSITVNPETYGRLKMAYDRAIEDNKEQFTFEESELIVPFAKYLLEHMRNVLKLE